MKAVMVIDMPNRCFNCPLHQTIDGEEENEFIVVCNAEHWREPTTHQPITNLNERPDWCPLRPMPEQMSWGHTADYIYGHNDCLDEITGEAE